MIRKTIAPIYKQPVKSTKNKNVTLTSKAAKQNVFNSMLKSEIKRANVSTKTTQPIQTKQSTQLRTAVKSFNISITNFLKALGNITSLPDNERAAIKQAIESLQSLAEHSIRTVLSAESATTVVVDQNVQQTDESIPTSNDDTEILASIFSKPIDEPILGISEPDFDAKEIVSDQNLALADIIAFLSTAASTATDDADEPRERF